MLLLKIARYLGGSRRHAHPTPPFRRRERDACMGRIAASMAAATLLLAAQAAAQTVAITPANGRIGYTVFALGLLPVRGHFEHFAGSITWLPGHPDSCQVDVEVAVASLRMDDPGRQRAALAPGMLDAAAYPSLHFSGACAADLVTGRLSLHGITRPFAVTWQYMPQQIVGYGALRRTDFGVNGLAAVLSPTVHIRFSIALPATLRMPG
jgi:polyisoprenoid-binding protein YceI